MQLQCLLNSSVSYVFHCTCNTVVVNILPNLMSSVQLIYIVTRYSNNYYIILITCVVPLVYSQVKTWVSCHVYYTERVKERRNRCPEFRLDWNIALYWIRCCFINTTVSVRAMTQVSVSSCLGLYLFCFQPFAFPRNYALVFRLGYFMCNDSSVCFCFLFSKDSY